MLILKRSKFNFELKIESLDDLWILSEFITPDDVIFATTQRKVKIGNDTSAKQIKKIIFVELKVKKTIFDSEILRIFGEIRNETQFTAIGQSQTLNFKIGDKIKILKNNLLKYEEKLLENACKSKKSMNFLVLLDKDELVTSEFSNISFRILFEKKGLGSKKYTSEEINENEQKFKLIDEYLKRDYSKIILTGPGIYKDNLKKYIKDKIGIETISFSYPDVNTTSVSKAIEKIQKSGILSESQIAKESENVSKLLENINKKEKYSYGKENSFNAINEGKAQILLISTKLISKEKEKETYKELNKIMKNIELTNGELIIINSKNESGKILDGLGGIGCINRY